jgi:hypothetical protein
LKEAFKAGKTVYKGLRQGKKFKIVSILPQDDSEKLTEAEMQTVYKLRNRAQDLIDSINRMR